MIRKRVINRWALVLISLILFVIISIFKIPRYLKEQRLYKLGYKKEEVKLLFKKRIANKILNGNLYSENIIQAVKKDDFQKYYYDLYVVRKNVDKKDINLYRMLKDKKGYSDIDLLKLFAKLPPVALDALSIFPKVEVDKYLADYLENNKKGTNTLNLANDYLKAYEKVEEIKDKSALDAFISKKYTLGNYVPQKLVAIPERYAIKGLYLRSSVLNYFTDMCDKLASDLKSEGIYAVEAYVSYKEQSAIYNDYGIDADKFITRPGFADEQSGLSVSVVSSISPSVSDFTSTNSYKWLVKNAASYGFIERFPSGKEAFTLRKASGAYWRYVGKELALKIKNSNLSYDEYFYKNNTNKD